MNEGGNLWRNAIVTIHNLKKKTLISEGKHPNGVWRNIHKEINYIHKLNLDFNKVFKLIPGCRTNILFWKATWYGSSKFQVQFPTVYKLETVKCCNLEERFSASGFTWRWNRIRMILHH